MKKKFIKRILQGILAVITLGTGVLIALAFCVEYGVFKKEPPIICEWYTDNDVFLACPKDQVIKHIPPDEYGNYRIHLYDSGEVKAKFSGEVNTETLPSYYIAGQCTLHQIKSNLVVEYYSIVLTTISRDFIVSVHDFSSVTKEERERYDQKYEEKKQEIGNDGYIKEPYYYVCEEDFDLLLSQTVDKLPDKTDAEIDWNGELEVYDSRLNPYVDVPETLGEGFTQKVPPHKRYKKYLRNGDHIATYNVFFSDESE